MNATSKINTCTNKQTIQYHSGTVKNSPSKFSFIRTQKDNSLNSASLNNSLLGNKIKEEFLNKKQLISNNNDSIMKELQLQKLMTLNN